MPIPAKPCNGQFSEPTIHVLLRNLDRAQWSSQRCDVCGQQVGAMLLKGKWVPESHWPSVRYVPRTARKKSPPTLAGASLKGSDSPR